VFERTEVTVIEQVADERPFLLLDAISLDTVHRFRERDIADELREVVVSRRRTDHSLRIGRRFQQCDLHGFEGGGGLL
jgi:hypothetical protein